MDQARSVTATFVPTFVIEPEQGAGNGGRVALGAGTNRACFLSAVTGQFGIGGGDVRVTIEAGEWVLTASGLVTGYAQCIAWPSASAISVDPESAWLQDQGPTVMGDAANRFCGLSRMAGKYQGGGELITTFVGGGRWLLGGTSAGAFGITAGARCITWPASTRLSYTDEHLWAQGQASVDLGPVASRACAFTLITGAYIGDGEITYVRPIGPSWSLGGGSQQNGVASRARCLTTP